MLYGKTLSGDKIKLISNVLCKVLHVTLEGLGKSDSYFSLFVQIGYRNTCSAWTKVYLQTIYNMHCILCEVPLSGN